MKIKLTNEQLEQNLKELLLELESLCKMYDIGNDIVYRSISVKIRVLFHQTNSSNSLLNQLNLLDHTMVSTSGQKIQGNLFKFFYGLVSVQTSTNPNQLFIPGKIIKRNKTVTFEYWWKEEIVLTDQNGCDFTRESIVLKVVNKDGGGHVDSELPIEYLNLKSGKTTGIVFNRDGITYTDNPIVASIRQIAEEVLLSFKSFI